MAGGPTASVPHRRVVDLQAQAAGVAATLAGRRAELAAVTARRADLLKLVRGDPRPRGRAESPGPEWTDLDGDRGTSSSWPQGVWGGV